MHNESSKLNSTKIIHIIIIQISRNPLQAVYSFLIYIWFAFNSP